jgi:hypothetical protein
MYLVVVYNDFEKSTINCMAMFDKIKDIIEWSGGILKYNDLQKRDRIYRTYKSFFKIHEVSRKDERKYFPKFKKFRKFLKS